MSVAHGGERDGAVAVGIDCGRDGTGRYDTVAGIAAAAATVVVVANDGNGVRDIEAFGAEVVAVVVFVVVGGEGAAHHQVERSGVANSVNDAGARSGGFEVDHVARRNAEDIALVVGDDVGKVGRSAVARDAERDHVGLSVAHGGERDGAVAVGIDCGRNGTGRYDAVAGIAAAATAACIDGDVRAVYVEVETNVSTRCGQDIRSRGDSGSNDGKVQVIVAGGIGNLRYQGMNGVATRRRDGETARGVEI